MTSLASHAKSGADAKIIVIFEAPLKRDIAEHLGCDWAFRNGSDDQPRENLATSPTPFSLDMADPDVCLPGLGDDSGFFRAESIDYFKILRVKDKADDGGGEHVEIQFRAHFAGSTERRLDLCRFWLDYQGEEIDFAIRSRQMELKAQDDAERAAAAPAGPALASTRQLEIAEGKTPKKRKQQTRGDQQKDVFSCPHCDNDVPLDGATHTFPGGDTAPCVHAHANQAVVQ
jgi:hypothetical protein